MKTHRFTILRADGVREEKTIEAPRHPSFDLLDRLIRPILDGADLEHVSALHNGKRTDMFVDDIGRIKKLPRNEAATAIYRNNWLSQNPDAEPEGLPYIVGTAVLFAERVWF